MILLIAGIVSLALFSESASAHFNLFDAFSSDSDKDKKDKKDKKSKSKDDDDDDDEDQDKEQKKREKEEKKRAEKAAKSSGKSESEGASAMMKAAKSESSKKADAKAMAGPSAAAMAEPMDAVFAVVETDPVPHGGDAADDPAIWIHPKDASQSTIIGSDKQGGIAVYDLSGKQIQYLPDGLMDNVDLRDGFSLGGEKVAIVTASNRKDNSIAIYKVNAATRKLEPAAARVVKHGMTVYGMCMYRSARSGKFYYFGTSKSGDVEQYELVDAGGKVDAKKVRNFKVGTVIEGCVADDELGQFYVSEEAVGIWKYGAEPEAGEQRTQVDKVGGHLKADVEGLAIAYGPDGKGYLMVSSQGDYSYVVYRREGNNEFVRKFRIGNGEGIDGAEETDGIDVTTANLGPAFPNGLFVVQDGFNDKGNQNFKLVPLQAIIKQ
ncbi:MAG: phytase [Blastocatellia bacterium]|nr:phytase [Blastocatellia bacterium]